MNGTTKAATPSSNSNRVARILCIDDDPEISRSIELRLGEFQVDVRRAFFGMQGFWEAMTDIPDLIIMDLAMPNGDGRFVLESLKNNQQTADVPVIILTGMRDKSCKRTMLSLGADQFLTKPIRFDDLFHEISRFLTLELKWAEGEVAR